MHKNQRGKSFPMLHTLLDQAPATRSLKLGRRCLCMPPPAELGPPWCRASRPCQAAPRALPTTAPTATSPVTSQHLPLLLSDGREMMITGLLQGMDGGREGEQHIAGDEKGRDDERESTSPVMAAGLGVKVTGSGPPAPRASSPTSCQPRPSVAPSTQTIKTWLSLSHQKVNIKQD